MVRLPPVRAEAAAAASPARDDRAPHGREGWLERAYGLDLRSLSVFRIGLAAMIIADLLWRTRDLRAFYTDFGVLPRAVLLGQFADPWQISVHLMNGTALVQAGLFLLALAFAVLLLVGYRTRTAAAVSWFLLISLQNRNPVVLQGGDILLRLMAFWAMFVPLNAYFSLDRALDPTGARVPDRICTAGTMGLLAQVAFVYGFAALLKNSPTWWREGTAVYYALSLQQFATPAGDYLLRFPGLLTLLTFATLLIEVFVPILLFLLWRPRLARTAAVVLLLALQVGLLVCLHLGHFPWVAFVATLPLIPGWEWWGFWRRRTAGTDATRGVAAVYYDGGCAFCRKTVALLKAFVLPESTRVLPAQEDPRACEEMRRENSWVVVDRGGRRFFRGAALAIVLRRSAWWPLALPLEHLLTTGAGDAAYGWVAARRPWLSGLVGWLQERPYTLRTSRPAMLLAAIFIVYVFWWNLGTVDGRLGMPPSWQSLGMATRTDQKWDMFAPYPLRDDGWYVIDGVLHSGRHADVFRGGAPVSYVTPSPAAIAAQYRDERWRKYLMNLYLAANADYRLYYGRYLCRSWNEERPAGDPNQLDTFRIYFMMRTTTLWNQPPEAYRKILLYSDRCF